MIQYQSLLAFAIVVFLSTQFAADTRANEYEENAATADTLVLCPGGLLEALQPWVDYRTKQGHTIAVVQPGATAVHVKRQVREIASNGNLKHLVIIGDVPNFATRRQQMAVPTDYVPARVNVKFGSEPEIATDNTYADVDGDAVPDLSVGRISVQSPEELSQQIDKIIRYESTATDAAWQRRINLIAGTGGFGQLSDQIIEKTARRLITDLIPSSYQTTMTYASWTSAYCPDPRLFASTLMERMNEGCLFWVYMGHGHPHRLDYVRTPVGGFPIFQQKHLQSINCPEGMPIALMLACYTGAFDFSQDCLAEQLVQKPCGPVAAICGTRVTMPYGMSRLSMGLIEEYFHGDEETLGGIMLNAKRHMLKSIEEAVANNERQCEYLNVIEVLGSSLSPTGDQLNDERKEHVHLFHLLGDPLLRVPRPKAIELSVPGTAESGSSIAISGTAPLSGPITLELSYPRDRFQKRPPRRRDFEYTDEELDKYQHVYDQSNERVCCQATIEVVDGKFQTTLPVPEWARGRCIVRGYSQAGKQIALGCAEIEVKRR